MREKERKEAMKNFAKKLALAGIGLAMVGTMTASHVNAALDTISDDLPNANDAMSDAINVTSDPSQLIKTIITLVIVVAALLTLFYLVMGAIAWITSGGDKGKVEEARNKITAAVIGLLILAAVWAIFNLVLTIAFGSNDVGIASFVNT